MLYMPAKEHIYLGKNIKPEKQLHKCFHSCFHSILLYARFDWKTIFRPRWWQFIRIINKELITSALQRFSKYVKWWEYFLAIALLRIFWIFRRIFALNSGQIVTKLSFLSIVLLMWMDVLTLCGAKGVHSYKNLLLKLFSLSFFVFNPTNPSRNMAL